jgi:hypothetical protein
MALEDERKDSSADQPETSLADEQVVVSAEAVSEQSARSDGEDLSEGSSDSRNVSDSDKLVKIGVEAALASISYDFGQSTMTKAHLTSLKIWLTIF